MHLFRDEDAPDDAGTTILDGSYGARRDRSPFDVGILNRRNDRLSGLTIARELLAASGGRIGVERTGPDGTTVLVEVPRAQRKTIPRM